MREEYDNPALVPPDDRFPSLNGLLKRPEDLTEEQFCLLAAEWAEGEMDPESVAEIESAFAADPRRKELAASFRLLRLSPGKETWVGARELLKFDVKASRIRRVLLLSLSAAAAVTAFIFLSPLMRENEKETSPLPVAEGPVIHRQTVKKEPFIYSEKSTLVEVNVASSENLHSEPAGTIEHEEIIRTEPVITASKIENVTLVASLNPTGLIPVATQQPPAIERRSQEEQNWILSSIDVLAGSENKPVDGYTIAGAVVRGVNKIFGWELSLEKVENNQGEPVEVNFNSSLLSFSAPVKKTEQ